MGIGFNVLNRSPLIMNGLTVKSKKYNQHNIDGIH